MNLPGAAVFPEEIIRQVTQLTGSGYGGVHRAHRADREAPLPGAEQAPGEDGIDPRVLKGAAQRGFNLEPGHDMKLGMPAVRKENRNSREKQPQHGKNRMAQAAVKGLPGPGRGPCSVFRFTFHSQPLQSFLKAVL